MNRRGKTWRSPKVVRAGWDAARTTSENRNHWRGAEEWLFSADRVASPEERRVLRARARSEVANNSYARGMVDTVADDIIGVGPRLQLRTGDPAFDQDLEAEFGHWCDGVGLTEKLLTLCLAKKQDGEAFAALVRRDGELDVEPVETDRVIGPDGFADDPNNIDGVRLDGQGRVKEYMVRRLHPGDDSGLGAEFDLVPARDMIHIFNRKRPGQHRGIPEIAPSLPLYSQLRRFTLATLAAAEGAADITAVMYSNLPPPPPKPGEAADGGGAVEVEPLDEIEFRRNMMLTLPQGWNMGQVKPEHPASTYKEFKREIINEIARCLGLPYNVAAGNSSGYNYASGRLDWQGYHKRTRREQHQWGRVALDPILRAWLEWRGAETRAREIVELLAGPIPHQWFWEGFEHVDPKKEADADLSRLRGGTTGHPELFARRGKDHVAEMTANAQALGLTLEEYRKHLVKFLFAPPGAAASAADADEEDDTAEGEADES